MRFKKAFAVLALSLLAACDAHADLYFEQNVRATETRAGKGPAQKDESVFKRKVFVAGGLLVIQIQEGVRLKKEYGFDFTRNLYYEAVTETGYFKLFDLDVLAAAFDKTNRKAPRFEGPRDQVVRDLSKAVSEGSADYPIHVRKWFFMQKRIGNLPAVFYTLRAGPGSFFLNPYGWYHKADIWATTAVPGFSQFEALSAGLREKGAFYKIKHNQISDLVTTLSALGAFPLEIGVVARREEAGVTITQTGRETTDFIDTAPIDTNRFSYVNERARFSWDVVYSKGTTFGPEVTPKHGVDFSMRRSLPWLPIPGIFVIFTYLWFIRGYNEEDRFSLKKVLVHRAYILSSVLLVLELAHFLKSMPYLVSPGVELALVLAAGAAWITGQARKHLRNIDARMREDFLRHCPRCRDRIGTFYVVCPKCSQPLGPAPDASSSS